MERVHYRRVKPYGGGHAAHVSAGGFREKLITQAIVSGLVLAVALAVSVFDHPLSANIQYGLQRVFEGHTTANALVNDIQRRSQAWFDTAEEAATADSMTAIEGESKSPVPALSLPPEP
jgi:hypothetical protein